MKTVECGQIFLLACRQLRKKAQHNLIKQFLNLLNVPNEVATKPESGQLASEAARPEVRKSIGC